MADAGTSGSVGSTSSGGQQGHVSANNASNANAQGPVKGEKPQAKENGGRPVKGGTKQFAIPADNFVFGDENKGSKESKETKTKEIKEAKPKADKQPPVNESLSHDDLIKALEDEYDPKPQEQKVDEESEEDQSEENEGTERQRKRIQSLASRLKESTAQLTQMQQAVQQRDQQLQQYLGSVQQQMQQLQRQNAYLAGQMQKTTQQGQAQKEPDPLDALAERMDPRVQKAIAPLQQKLAAMEKQAADAKKAQQQAQISQQLNYAADQAVEQVVCAGWSPEARQSLGHEFGTLTMALAYGKNTSPTEAAKLLKTLIGRAAIEELKAKSAALKNKTDGRNIQPPTAAAASRSEAMGTPHASYKDARSRGSKDALDDMFKHNRGPI